MPRSLAHPRRSHPRRHYPHARRGPLDNGQKAALCILAREAFEHQFGAVLDAAALEAWRHEQTREAVGFESLRDAGQEHYKTLLAHFLNLKGESGKAFNLLRAEQTSGIDLAKRKLREALAAAGKAWSYAEAICSSQNHGLTIDELKSDKPIWRLVFTITNRGNAAKRKAAQSADDAALDHHEEDPY